MPVESVPIRLSRMTTPVAAAPETRTPIRLAEMTLPGADQGSRRVIGNAGLIIAERSRAGTGKPDEIAEDGIAGGVAARDIDARTLIRRDDVAVSRHWPANLIIGWHIVDPHAVRQVSRLALPN